jgi:hypothetical protein
VGFAGETETEAAERAMIDPRAIINWKMADGSFVTLDAQAITADGGARPCASLLCDDEAHAGHGGEDSSTEIRFLSRSLLPLHVRDVKETMTVAHILVKKIPET